MDLQANKMINILIDHPGHLFIGNQDTLLDHTITFLQNFVLYQ